MDSCVQAAAFVEKNSPIPVEKISRDFCVAFLRAASKIAPAYIYSNPRIAVGLLQSFYHLGMFSSGYKLYQKIGGKSAILHAYGFLVNFRLFSATIGNTERLIYSKNMGVAAVKMIESLGRKSHKVFGHSYRERFYVEFGIDSTSLKTGSLLDIPRSMAEFLVENREKELTKNIYLRLYQKFRQLQDGNRLSELIYGDS